MRKRSKEKSPISVHAIAGTEVVLLGLNADEEAAEGLLGFTIYKRRGASGKYWALPSGGRTFLGEQDEHVDEKVSASSEEAPIQAFMWSDYVVERGKTYSYKVVPVYGKPDDLRHDTANAVTVTVETEDPSRKDHGVYFNRGVAGSRAYAKKFGEHRRWYLDAGISEYLTNKDREKLLEENPNISEEELLKLETLYARPYIKPGDVPDREAYAWLSRGLEEAMLEFIGQAKRGDKIRAAVYEFTHERVIQAFVDALERGVDVQIVHHAKRDVSYRLKGAPRKKDDIVPAKPVTSTEWTGSGPRPDDEFRDPNGNPLRRYVVKDEIKDGEARAADASVARIGLKMPESDKNFEKLLKAFNGMMIEREHTPAISHNKFIVILKKGKPTRVWTGSTNFTEGGVFGQSNVGHIVRDSKIAKNYFEYWKQLSKDPVKPHGEPSDLQTWTVKQQPDLEGPPPKGITTVFSPRASGAMLDWYAEQLDGAKHAVFFTAAFSVADELFDIVKDVKKVGGQPYQDAPYLRYLALEGTGGHLEKKFPVIQACPQNRVAWGDTLRKRKGQDEEGHQQFIETLTGLNSHVSYLHTKYMLVDPLSSDPIVISGSANFSEASTKNNDENMLIIRGNTRVADIFLTEFMRLFNHFQTRNRLNALSNAKFKAARKLAANDSWTKPYYDSETQEYQERRLFG